MTAPDHPPTLVEFNRAIRGLIMLIDSEFFADAARRISMGQSEHHRHEAAASLVSKHWEAQQASFRDEHVRRILDDPAIVAAWDSASRSTKWASKKGVMDSTVEALLQTRSALFDFPPAYAEEALLRVLDDCTGTQMKWCVMTTFALREYFYDHSAVTRLNVANTRLQELEAAVRAGAEAFREITQMVVDEHASPQALADDAPEGAQSRILRSLNLKMAQLRRTLPPVIRQGETARERLLMYRVCLTHGSLFKAQKPTAVYELLHARGVRSLDRRNVDRACQAFSLRSQGRGMSEYRRILERLRRLAAGAEI